jgi:hypothetical protein
MAFNSKVQIGSDLRRVLLLAAEIKPHSAAQRWYGSVTLAGEMLRWTRLLAAPRDGQIGRWASGDDGNGFDDDEPEQASEIAGVRYFAAQGWVIDARPPAATQAVTHDYRLLAADATNRQDGHDWRCANPPGTPRQSICPARAQHSRPDCCYFGR